HTHSPHTHSPHTAFTQPSHSSHNTTYGWQHTHTHTHTHAHTHSCSLSQHNLWMANHLKASAGGVWVQMWDSFGGWCVCVCVCVCVKLKALVITDEMTQVHVICLC